MEHLIPYIIDVLNLLLRWLHLIVGIAWIGASFYFVWLDNSLTPPTDQKLKDLGVGEEDTPWEFETPEALKKLYRSITQKRYI